MRRHDEVGCYPIKSGHNVEESGRNQVLCFTSHSLTTARSKDSLQHFHGLFPRANTNHGTRVVSITPLPLYLRGKCLQIRCVWMMWRSENS
jgi:hypothetical protein